MVKEKPIPGGKKTRSEPAKAAEPNFQPVKVEISETASMILLLRSKELPVLVQVMSPLAHFANKSVECATQLIDNEILPSLLPLLNHENECCRRYAFRILSHLVTNEKCKLHLIETRDTTFAMVLNTLFNSTDAIFQEYSSKILSVLSEDLVVVSYLADTNPFDSLIKCLSSKDPDVQKNVLEIVSNLLIDPTVTPNKDFNFQPILQLFMSDYPAIQTIAIEVVFKLTERTKNIDIKEQFKKSGGVAKIMTLLERFDYKDLHTKLLLLINNLAETHEEFEALTPTDIKRLIGYASSANDAANAQQAWETLLTLTYTKSCREVLKEFQIIEKIISLLKTENESLSSSACVGLSNFLQDYDHIEEIVKLNPISALLFLLVNSHKWKTKECAVIALREAMKFSVDLQNTVTQNNNFEKIIRILNEPINEVPVKVMKGAIECLIILARSETFRNLVDSSITEKAVHIFEVTKDDVLRVVTLDLLNQLMCDYKFSSKLPDGLVDIIWKTTIEHAKTVPVATAAAHFISMTAKNNDAIANAFIKTGTLHWILRYKDLTRAPIWKSVMNVLFSKHLSAKFAYNGRLEFTDVIKDQFYARKDGISKEKQLEEQFPIYEDILKTAEDRSIKPIYLVNIANVRMIEDTYNNSTTIINDEDDNKRRSTKTTLRKSVGKSSKTSVLKENKSNTDNSSKVSSGLVSFDYKSEDFFLMKYIEQVKDLFKEHELLERKIKDKSSVLTDKETLAQVELIAKYVCNQLSGPDRSLPCTSHYIDLHVDQIKNELGSNLIPIGLLRAGLAIERAILFKVLADQVSLPCALARSRCGQAWTEVSLPAVSPPAPFYPTTLIKPTHIVDLLYSPGQLLQLGSFAANKYSTCPPLCTYDKSIK